MDDTERVLVRLRRIDALRIDTLTGAARGDDPSGGGDARALLAELRALVPEAEAWARAEGDARARRAAAKLREEAEGMR
jgi:hypothetical protein